MVGIAEVADCRPPVNTPAAYAEAEPYHRIPPARQGQAFADGWRTPWVLANARPLKKSVPYKHPSGAVIWVTLDDAVSAAISELVSPVPPAPDVTNGSSANPPIRSEPRWEMVAPPEVQQEVHRSPFPLGSVRIVIVTGGNSGSITFSAPRFLPSRRDRRQKQSRSRAPDNLHHVPSGHDDRQR